MVSIGLISTIIASTALVVIALFISLSFFAYNRRAAPGLIYFVVLCYSLAAWLLANILSDIYLTQSLFWVRLSFISISAGLFCFLMFANRFPQPRYSSRTENVAHTSVLVLVLLVLLSDAFIPRVVLEDGIATVVPGPLYSVFIVYIAYTLTLAISRIIRVRVLSPAYWQHARLILIGIGTAAGVALITNLILPLILGTNSLYWVASLATLVFVASVAYAIVRRQLFDIRGALARAFAYTGSVAVLGLVLGILVAYVVKKLDLSGQHLQMAIIAATVAVAALYPFIKLLFDAITEKVFYRRTYNVQSAINEMTAIFSRAETLDSMSRRMITQLKRFLGSECIALVLLPQSRSDEYYVSSSPSGWLDLASLQTALQATSKQKVFAVDSVGGIDEALLKVLSDSGIGLVSQLQSPTGRIGYLLLGHRRNGAAYTKRDITFISTISDECAIVVQSLGRLQEILALNSSLNEKISAATEELRGSNKKLRTMDQTKDEFISLTSHQLRTPLTTIKGYLSMLLDGDAGDLTPQQRKLVEEAFNSSQRMVHLISDFLNISRIQTGKFMLELSEANLADVLGEEIDLLRISANSKRIILDYKRPENFPVMEIDEGKIRQVMMNFIDNSLYYSPAGTTVRVTLVHTSQFVEFRVIDQGIGVPKDEQHKLFAKFSRASNAKKQRPDGTGIGLFMAKKVIVALGGSIIFKSEEGKGSTFGFRLNRTRPAK